MLEQKEITIGGDTFVIQQLPATKGLECAVRLARVLSGAAEGIGEFQGDLMNIRLDPGRIVRGLMSRLDDGETPGYLKRLIRDSLVQPHFSDEFYETRFSGSYQDLFDLTGEILELNFGPTLETLKKRVRRFIGRLFTAPGQPPMERASTS